MPLSKEQFEQLPEFVQGDYVLDGEIYVQKSEMQVRGLKTSLDNLDAKMREAEKKKAEEFAAFQAEALEKAKKANNFDEVLRIEREQAEDAKNRALEDAKKAWERERQELDGKTRADGIAKEIAYSIAVDEYAAELIYQAIKQRVSADIDLKKDIFHDRNGSALSVDKAGFAELVKKEPHFARLIKAPITTHGAGGANGTTGGCAPNRKFNEYDGAELSLLQRTNPQEYARLKAEFYQS